MFAKNYDNFVRPVSSNHNQESYNHKTLSGEEARKIYLDEVKEIKDPSTTEIENDIIVKPHSRPIIPHKLAHKESELSNKELFLSVQNNDVDIIKQELDCWPDKIRIVDEYGWSLLMIACQANSIETVQELLKRGVDTSVRDKAGNSAQSLVIKNKNYKLADILVSFRSKNQSDSNKIKFANTIVSVNEFFCEVCNTKVKINKNDHISSTVHNINLSKGKKIPTNYVIPESNRGYQIMLRVGWNKESGLGPDGSGKKYPIKTVQKKDRNGLGHRQKRKLETEKLETERHKNRKSSFRECEYNRKMEINFRRQFY